MGRVLADGANAGAVAAAADGWGGSVCIGFGFAVGLVVCAQQVCDLGGFVSAAMAGLDGGRFRRGVRLCGVFYAGFAGDAGGKGGGGCGGESRADAAAGGLAFRRTFKREDFGGYAAGGLWRDNGGHARTAFDGIVGRHQGGGVADFRLRGLLGGLYLNRTRGLARNRRADGNGGNVIYRRVDVVGGGVVDGLPFEAMAAMDARGWTALAWLVIGATVLAYAWYFEGVKILGAGSAAAYITLVPIFGVLSSAWFLGEPLHISLVAGCVAAVGGMTLMRYGQKAV